MIDLGVANGLGIGIGGDGFIIRFASACRLAPYSSNCIFLVALV